jgi:predicted transcriptional regulator
LAKLKDVIISMLENSAEGMTLAEIAEEVGESEKKVYKALRKLFSDGLVDSQNRRYKLSAS